MIKKLLLFAGLLFFVHQIVNGQHLIGLTKTETRLKVKTMGFFPDEMTTSKSFNYLKYVNHAGTKTLLVFFSDEGLSTHTRMVCDYAEYDFILDELDNNKDMKKKGKFRWIYKENREQFEVTLEEKEWYFVVRVKKS